MNEKELRIGNLVNHAELGIVEIIATGKDYLHCIFNNETFYENIGHFSPIPLTEEWLLKFGFSLMKESEYTLNTFERDEFQLWNKKGDFSEIVYLSNKDRIEIKHGHQLQNLYFALKGKELTLK